MGFFFTIHIQLSDQLANIHVISPEQQNLKEYLSLPTERWYNSMLAFACEAHTEVTLSPPGVAATLPLSFRDVFPSQRRIFTAAAVETNHFNTNKSITFCHVSCVWCTALKRNAIFIESYASLVSPSSRTEAEMFWCARAGRQELLTNDLASCKGPQGALCLQTVAAKHKLGGSLVN